MGCLVVYVLICLIWGCFRWNAHKSRDVFDSSNLQNTMFFLMCLYHPFEVTGTTPVLQMSQLRKWWAQRATWWSRSRAKIRVPTPVPHFLPQRAASPFFILSGCHCHQSLLILTERMFCFSVLFCLHYNLLSLLLWLSEIPP